jgi:radical SAM protein with 4Fe4S-binding SPASM domain
VPLFFPPLDRAGDIRAYYENHRETFGYDQCVSIYMTMEVNPNGDVSLCRDYHDYVIGNVTRDRVQDVWHSAPARAFRSTITNDGLLPACRRCCGLMGF